MRRLIASLLLTLGVLSNVVGSVHPGHHPDVYPDAPFSSAEKREIPPHNPELPECQDDLNPFALIELDVFPVQGHSEPFYAFLIIDLRSGNAIYAIAPENAYRAIFRDLQFPTGLDPKLIASAKSYVLITTAKSNYGQFSNEKQALYSAVLLSQVDVYYDPDKKELSVQVLLERPDPSGNHIEGVEIAEKGYDNPKNWKAIWNRTALRGATKSSYSNRGNSGNGYRYVNLLAHFLGRAGNFKSDVDLVVQKSEKGINFVMTPDWKDGQRPDDHIIYSHEWIGLSPDTDKPVVVPDGREVKKKEWLQTKINAVRSPMLKLDVNKTPKGDIVLTPVYFPEIHYFAGHTFGQFRVAFDISAEEAEASVETSKDNLISPMLAAFVREDSSFFYNLFTQGIYGPQGKEFSEKYFVGKAMNGIPAAPYEEWWEENKAGIIKLHEDVARP